MASQGRPLSETEIRKIITFLASTDMSIGEIATRMGCCRSAIVQLNRRHAVREYAGNRTRWKVAV
jgi:IS30 family transposase